MKSKETYFTNKEKNLMLNTEIFPLKRIVTEKLFDVFHSIIQQIKDNPLHQQFVFPAGTDVTTGKISRGENYKNYPYVILDFPRLFTSDRIFAYRTMFWFGHYFTFSLVVSGNLCEQYFQNLLRNKKKLGDFILFSTHPDVWTHDINDGYAFIKDVSSKQISLHVQEHQYFKIVRTLQWADTEKIMNEAIQTYMLFLKTIS